MQRLMNATYEAHRSAPGVKEREDRAIGPVVVKSFESSSDPKLSPDSRACLARRVPESQSGGPQAYS
jgi:hypothetical protein